MKNAFAILISGLGMAGERISELKDISVETPKTEKQRGKWAGKTMKKIAEDYRASAKGVTYT